MPMSILNCDAEIERLREEVGGWKRLFCALALEAGGELRVSKLSQARIYAPGSKTTFETFTEKDTGDRVFRIVEEQSVDSSREK